jgi:hypothetical protein
VRVPHDDRIGSAIVQWIAEEWFGRDFPAGRSESWLTKTRENENEEQKAWNDEIHEMKGLAGFF